MTVAPGFGALAQAGQPFGVVPGLPQPAVGQQRLHFEQAVPLPVVGSLTDQGFIDVAAGPLDLHKVADAAVQQGIDILIPFLCLQCIFQPGEEAGSGFRIASGAIFLEEPQPDLGHALPALLELTVGDAQAALVQRKVRSGMNNEERQ